MFWKLNDLNISLQGKHHDMFKLRGKMMLLKRKYYCYKRFSWRRSTKIFQFWIMHQRTGYQPASDKYCSRAPIFTHWILWLLLLKKSPRQGNMRLIEPFTTNVEDNSLSMNESERLSGLSSDYSLEVSVMHIKSSFFAFRAKETYALTSERTTEILIQFSTTYLL